MDDYWEPGNSVGYDPRNSSDAVKVIEPEIEGDYIRDPDRHRWWVKDTVSRIGPGLAHHFGEGWNTIKRSCVSDEPADLRLAVVEYWGEEAAKQWSAGLRDEK